MFQILVRLADYLIILFKIYTAQKVPIESTPPHSEVMINNLNISPSMFNDHDSNDSYTTLVEDISYQNKSSEQSKIGNFFYFC